MCTTKYKIMNDTWFRAHRVLKFLVKNLKQIIYKKNEASYAREGGGSGCVPILDSLYNARIPRPCTALLHPGGRKALALYRWGPGPGGKRGIHLAAGFLKS